MSSSKRKRATSMRDLNMHAPSLSTRSSKSTGEGSLKAAFATSDLGRICRAIDAAVLEGGIATVAYEANVARTTIHRAFRYESGPALDTLVKVLQVLGLHLIVEIRTDLVSERVGHDAKATARLLTMAFRGRDLHLAIAALATVLSSQDNIAELARNTVLTRENLYRTFEFPRIPRFRTALTFLNAIGLQFGVEREAVERRPSKNGPASRGIAEARVMMDDRRSIPSIRDHRAKSHSKVRKGHPRD